MAHEAQVRYSNLVDLKLRKTLVKKVGVICNNRYEGSPKAGSVKVPVRDTEVVVNDYDKAKGAKQTSGDTTYLTVNIDHDKAVNEIIDGFDAESVPGNLVADRLDSAGYSLGLQMDSDGSVELTTAGTAFGNTTALTEKTIYANIVDARTQQSSIGVPTAGRWLLVSPDTYGLLLKSPEFIKASDLGDAIVQTGAVGKIAGYTVFEDSTLGENVEYVAGHPNWFAVIDEWAVPVHLQDLSGSGDFIGASAVQGRKVYAYKVTKGQTILLEKGRSIRRPPCFTAPTTSIRQRAARWTRPHSRRCASGPRSSLTGPPLAGPKPTPKAAPTVPKLWPWPVRPSSQCLERAEAARAATGYAPGVTSVNNDGFAVTFSDGALAEKQAAEAHSILSGCLGHDPHGLLYRGCF